MEKTFLTFVVIKTHHIYTRKCIYKLISIMKLSKYLRVIIILWIPCVILVVSIKIHIGDFQKFHFKRNKFKSHEFFVRFFCKVIRFTLPHSSEAPWADPSITDTSFTMETEHTFLHVKGKYKHIFYLYKIISLLWDKWYFIPLVFIISPKTFHMTIVTDTFLAYSVESMNDQPQSGSIALKSPTHLLE